MLSSQPKVGSQIAAQNVNGRACACLSFKTDITQTVLGVYLEISIPLAQTNPSFFAYKTSENIYLGCRPE